MKTGATVQKIAGDCFTIDRRDGRQLYFRSCIGYSEYFLRLRNRTTIHLVVWN
jgi:hypothetical protein